MKARPITAFWHVCLINRWRPLIAEQLLLIQSSGLVSQLDTLWVSLIGIEADRAHFRELTIGLPFIVIGAETTDVQRYEFPAIEAIHAWASSNPLTRICLYFHSKGISYPDDQHARWRDILNEGVLLRWRDHLQAIYEGADVPVRTISTTNSSPRISAAISGLLAPTIWRNFPRQRRSTSGSGIMRKIGFVPVNTAPSHCPLSNPTRDGFRTARTQGGVLAKCVYSRKPS